MDSTWMKIILKKLNSNEWPNHDQTIDVQAYE